MIKVFGYLLLVLSSMDGPRVGIDADLELPVMICCLGFPGIPCPLHVFQPHYRSMVRRALNTGSRRFGLFIQGSGPCALAEVGVVLQIKNCEPLSDGRMLIDTCGRSRIRVLSGRVVDGCTTIRFEFYSDKLVDLANIDGYNLTLHTVHSLAAEWLSKLPCATRASLVPFFGGLPSFDSVPHGVRTPTAPAWVWWLVAVLPLNEKCRYKLLSCREPTVRIELLKNILSCLISGAWIPCTDAAGVMNC